MKLTKFLCTVVSVGTRQTTATTRGATTKIEKINRNMIHIYDEATAGEAKPIAVLYAWLQAKERYLSK